MGAFQDGFSHRSGVSLKQPLRDSLDEMRARRESPKAHLLFARSDAVESPGVPAVSQAPGGR